MDRFNPASSNLLSATDARALIEKGLLTSCELVEACFARIDELELTIEGIGTLANPVRAATTA